MANKNDKVAKNAAGAFYVDNSCISCGQCVAAAPEFFQEDTASGLMYVGKQPVGDAEIKACREAMAGCPVDSIGDDGQ